MAGIKDLLNLYYWIDNKKEVFMDASVGQSQAGTHKSDQQARPEQNQKLFYPRKASAKKNFKRK